MIRNIGYTLTAYLVVRRIQMNSDWSFIAYYALYYFHLGVVKGRWRGGRLRGGLDPLLALVTCERLGTKFADSFGAVATFRYTRDRFGTHVTQLYVGGAHQIGALPILDYIDDSL